MRDQLPHLEYGTSKHWASFRSLPTGRVVAYLHPSKQRIRLFLGILPDRETDLRPTPSSRSWAERFPSIFEITGEQQLAKAVRLIGASESATEDGRRIRTIRREYSPAEELVPSVEYLEGAARRILVNAYERNRTAREQCLLHYGRTCLACGFDFAARYGREFEGYIHVHHVVPVSQVGKEYVLDPIRDLRPVCANCHAAIHRREPPFSIDEIKQLIKAAC